MNEKRNFEKTPKEEMFSEEDDFLELTDEAAPMETGDSDIIMLHEEVSPEPAVGASEADILDLTEDVLLPDEVNDMDLLELLEEASDTAVADDDDDDILDLTEETPITAVNDSAGIRRSQKALSFPAPKNDEDILELSEAAPGEDFSEPATVPAEAAEGDADMEDILMLLEDESTESDKVIPPKESALAPRAKDLLEDGFELGEALDAAIDAEAAADKAAVGAMGMSLADASDENQLATLPVSNTQVEAALERVIERMLGEKMYRLLTAAIEKAVTNEIKRLKKLLASNLSDME
ncbi:MAG: hypothetical protein RBT11_02860 [Desulfobacterales bacterium]|nr:hypothetical protein [Desulfobacterales bacterium]